MNPAPLRVLSWNLQGSHGVDTAAVAGVIAEQAPDVVVLQEVQRRQLDRLAAATAMPARRWIFKHLAPPRWPEGVGLLTRHRLVESRSLVLRRSLLFNWQRRVALIATIERHNGTGADGADRIGVVSTHLSAHGEGDARRREIDTLVADVGRTAPLPLIAGDLNDLPGGAAPTALAAHGWRDSWTTDDPGATNWTPGSRTGRPPTQRLDYIFVPAGWAVRSAWVAAACDRHDWFAELSDHLPLCAELIPPVVR